MNLPSFHRSACFGTVLGLAAAMLGGIGCAPAYTSGPSAPAYTRDKGVIKGARFKVLVPDNWTGDLLVRAHGYRPLSASLAAHLHASDPVVADLLDQGWMVATTSYRRNGLIIADAQKDLDNLIAAIVSKYGPCRRIILEGSSMGANIGLLLAEQQTESPAQPGVTISGVVALGAAPRAEGENGSIGWTHEPDLPVLFVSNRSEIDAVRAYARQAWVARQRPSVWVLDRDGHVNVNAAERLAAIAAVAAWVSGGRQPSGDGFEPHDATIVIVRKQVSAVDPGVGVWGDIEAIDPIYGNVDANLGEGELLALGMELGSRLWVSCGEVAIEAIWGTTYDDVAEGEVVVFATADGLLRVAVNLGHAAQRLACQVGEPLKITPLIESLPCGN